jgi:hypothetical protein
MHSIPSQSFVHTTLFSLFTSWPNEFEIVQTSMAFANGKEGGGGNETKTNGTGIER